uniref:MASE3 domain-containing protein n=1 Tax=uncultured Thiodictyon sp. TaxID=1846217 RepID=UPI0025E99BF6
MSKLRLDALVRTPGVAVAGVLLAIMGILAGARSVHYLLFHTMAELFAIVVSLCIFVLTWSSNRYLANGYLIVLGGAYGAYGAIGFVDLFHTLTFKGMNLFPGVSTNYPTQFWLTARYLEAIALLLGPLAITRRPRFALVSAGFAIVALAACAAVVLQWFPATFIDGVGLTPFKVNSEYIIIAMLVVGFMLLYRNRRHFESRIFLLLAGSLWLAVATEFCFTRYAGFYDVTNELGHYFRFLSVALAFIAVVLSGVRQPFDLIFREMEANKRQLVELNEKLAKSEERYRTAFVTSPDAFTITRMADGQYVDVNEGFVFTFGWTRDEVIGRTALELGIWHHPQDRRRLVEPLQQNDYFKNLEVELVAKDGRVITSLVSAHAITMEGDRCLLAVTRDITGLKQAEAALHEADRRKNEFLAMLGHELRNPLAPINNAVEILQQTGLDGAHFTWCRDIIARQTQHLTRLVDDLLDISRITRGKIELRMELVEVVDIL